MFGFLRVPKKGLDGCQSTLYRAHFCAVCHALHRETGLLSALLTNYDITFWTLLGSALQPVQRLLQGRCTALPWRQIPVLELEPGPRLALTAITHHLVASKLQDDALDGERRPLAWALRALHQPASKARRTLQQLGLSTRGLDQLFSAQSAVERRAGLEMAAYCRPTREMTAEVFGYLAALHRRRELEQSLQGVGWHLGGLLYGLDAVTDYTSDRARNRFNAIDRAFGEGWNQSQVGGWLLGELRALAASLLALPLGAQRGALCENLLRQLEGRIYQSCPLVHIQCDCGGCEVCCACGDGCQAGCGEGCCHSAGVCGECGSCCPSGCDACIACPDCCNCSSCCCDRSDPAKDPPAKEGGDPPAEPSPALKNWQSRSQQSTDPNPEEPAPGPDY